MDLGKKPHKMGTPPAVPITLKVKDPEIVRMLTSGEIEEFVQQGKSFQDACLDLIFDYWRFSKILKKGSVLDNPEISESFQRFGDDLKKHGFVIKDMTGNSYNDGMVLDVIHFDKSKDEDLKTAVITETIRPAIYLNDKLIQKSEVIVTRPNNESVEE